MSLPSPCISICQIDPETGNCVGCYRNRQEIARWPSMNLNEQAQLLQALKERRADKIGLHPRQNRPRRKN